MRRAATPFLLGTCRIAPFLAAVLVQAGCSTPAGTSDDLTVGSIEVFGNSTVASGATIVLHTLIKGPPPAQSTIPSSSLLVSWSSNDPSVASVSQSGVVTGGATGDAIITAEAKGVRGSKLITVTGAPQVPVATVTISGPNVVYLNEKAQLQVVLRDAGNNQLTGRNVVWTSSAPAVASVNISTGEVTGVTQGSAVITATCEGKSATYSVAARLHVDHIEITGPTTIRVGEAVGFNAAAKSVNNTVVLDPALTWVSSDPSRATVSSGTTAVLVTGIAAGTAQLTVSAEGKSASVTITVAPAGTPAVLQGRVIDYATGNGIGGATVWFLSGVNALSSVTTSASGDFTSAPITFPQSGIIMEATAATYVTARVLVDAAQNSATIYTEPIPLVKNGGQGSIAGRVINARTGHGLLGAAVQVFDNIVQSPIREVISGSNGDFTVPNLPAGTYRLVGVSAGYQNTSRVGVNVGNGATTGGQDLVLSPTGTNDIRIVLTWGTSPWDLDAHLTGPNTDATRFHVYFVNPGGLTGPPFAFLDIDDTNQYGPETITISQMNSGNYRFTVHDYDNRNSVTSTALGSSGAKVQVYNATSLIQTFFVPHEAGNLWTVFEMTGTLQNPVITPRNSMGFGNCAGCITSPPAVVEPRATDAELIGKVTRKGVRVPR